MENKEVSSANNFGLEVKQSDESLIWELIPDKKNSAKIPDREGSISPSSLYGSSVDQANE